MPDPHRAHHDEYITRYVSTQKAKVMGSTRVLQAVTKSGKVIPIRLALSEGWVNGRFLFTALLERVVDRSFILTVDKKGIVLGVTGNAQPLFGYSNDELVGKTINMLMPPSVAKVHDHMLSVYNPHARVQRVVGKVRKVDALHKSGYTFPITISVRVDEQLMNQGNMVFITKYSLLFFRNLGIFII